MEDACPEVPQTSSTSARRCRSGVARQALNAPRTSNMLLRGGCARMWTSRAPMHASVDPGWLAQVFGHLIGIAWKFTVPRPLARWSAARPSRNGPVYFDRHNGAGFATALATRLFPPFHRLHGVAEFEGIGMASRSCRRHVEQRAGAPALRALLRTRLCAAATAGRHKYTVPTRAFP